MWLVGGDAFEVGVSFLDYFHKIINNHNIVSNQK